MSTYNLPPGCTTRDIDAANASDESRCQNCGAEAFLETINRGWYDDLFCARCVVDDCHKRYDALQAEYATWARAQDNYDVATRSDKALSWFARIASARKAEEAARCRLPQPKRDTYCACGASSAQHQAYSGCPRDNRKGLGS